MAGVSAFNPEDPGNSPPPEIRVADSDRELAAERLRAAVADGRLELAELDERLEAAYTAKTAGELDRITVDLPAVRAAETEDRVLKLQATSGSRVKKGVWNVPSKIIASCTSGSIKLDFTQARCTHQRVGVQATAKSGSVVMIVPKGWGAVMDDVGIASGSVNNRVPELPEPGFPLLVVEGQATSGSIKARYRRRTFWEWLLRRPVH